MAATITFIKSDGTTGTTLSTADATTGWTGPASNADNPFVQGTASLGLKVSAATTWFAYNNGATIDVTNNYLYVWVAVTATLDTHANGGIRIRVATATSTNYGEWHVAGNSGNSVYPGGFVCYSVKLNLTENPFDLTGGTAPTDLTAIQHFGPVFKITQTIMGTQLTCFVDAMRIGTGLRISGATHATPGVFADIIAADEGTVGNRYGVVRDVNGVMMTQGQLIFGDTTGTHFFRDSNKAIVFEKHLKTAASGTPSTTDFFGDGNYKISVVGDTQLRLGNRVGIGTASIGSQPVTINSGSTYRYTFDLSATATDIIQFYGLNVSKADNVYLGSTTNALTGSVVLTGSNTIAFNNANPDTITRAAGSFVTEGFLPGMTITVSGATDTANNTTFTLDAVVALTLTLISTDAVTVRTGETTIAIVGTAVEIIDSTFSNTRRVVRNITSSPNELRNTISFNTDTAAGLDLIDARSTDVNQWKIVQNPGYINTTTATTALTLSNQNFTQATTPYVTLGTNETWTVTNPTWTIVDQTQLNFGGGTLSGASVDEKFSVSSTVQQTSGTKIQNARVKIIEASPTPAIANEGDTDLNGLASFNTLTNNYIGAAANALTTTTHSTFALKVYRYGYLPFTGAQAITAATAPGVTLLADTFQVETVEATAVADGTQKVVIIESAALNQSHSIIKFTGGTGTLNVGNTVTGTTSGATGVVEEIIEGNSTAGTVILKTRNSTSYSGTEALTESGVSSDWAGTLTSSSEKRFYWLVQAGTISGTKRSLQELYDHFQAKLGEATLDTADLWDKVNLDGRAEFGTSVQGVATGSPNSFKTIRNAALTHGWLISGLLSLSGLNLYTANDGTTFAPASLVTLQVTVKDVKGTAIQNAQTAIYKSSDNSELLNADTNASGIASVGYTYTADTNIYTRIRKSSTGTTRYFANDSSGTITSSGLNITVTLIEDTIATS